MAIGSPRQLLGFWKDKTFDDASEFSWGPGLAPPGKEYAPPSKGGLYRGRAPSIVSPPRRKDVPGYPGDPVAR